MKKYFCIMAIVSLLLVGCNARVEFEKSAQKKTDPVTAVEYQELTTSNFVEIRFKNGTVSELKDGGCQVIECTSRQLPDDCRCVSW